MAAARSPGGPPESPPPYLPIAVRTADRTRTSGWSPMAFLSSHVEAAVDGPDLPRDVRGPVIGEEGHHPGDILGPAKPPDGNFAPNPVEHSIRHRGPHFCRDEAGRHGVHGQADTVSDRPPLAAQLEHRLFCEPLR